MRKYHEANKVVHHALTQIEFLPLAFGLPLFVVAI
jgi:hypothetical protein